MGLWLRDPEHTVTVYLSHLQTIRFTIWIIPDRPAKSLYPPPKMCTLFVEDQATKRIKNHTTSKAADTWHMTLWDKKVLHYELVEKDYNNFIRQYNGLSWKRTPAPTLPPPPPRPYTHITACLQELFCICCHSFDEYSWLLNFGQ